MSNGIKTLVMAALGAAAASCVSDGNIVEIPAEVMADKVRGGWAGKMIGVMYGRPMEFAVTDRMYTDSIKWSPENVVGALGEDDIYGQMNFMATMEQYGQDVPVDSLAKNFAFAEFSLCHANLQARKNYLDGENPAALSTVVNNIHCEDIDFQIECDFIGFINPCMPQSSNRMCEKVGSIMSAADGLYAGMYVSAMHAIAYECSDIDSIVERALGAIPAESTYAACVRDVIEAHKANPADWTAAWRMLDEKWAPYDVCTPYHSFNIDAKLNGAYVVTGLLYGGGDWYKTMSITVGCGQDTDCNTATAAAVLGIVNGYDAIPDNLKSHIPAIADSCFTYTTYSFNRAVDQSMKFIDENVTANGGSVADGVYRIKSQKPVSPAYVSGFGDMRVSELVPVSDGTRWKFEGAWEDFVYGNGDDAPYRVSTRPGDIAEIDFDGTGVAILGSWNTDAGCGEAYIDGKKVRDFDCYYVTEAGKYEGNRAYLFFVRGLEPGRHSLRMVSADRRNPASSANRIYIEKMIAYK